MSEPVILTLLNGMELIAIIEKETETELELDFPLTLNYGVTEPQKEGDKPGFTFNFGPFVPLATRTKTLYKSVLVAKAAPKQGLLNAYQNATGRVLTPPSAHSAPELILS